MALVAVASGSVVLAGNDRPLASAPAVAATTAPAAGQSNPFDAAVQALVEEGTIDQAQADAVRQHIDAPAGSLDLQELIDCGVLTAAQGQAVSSRLGAVKQSLAAGLESQPPSAASPTSKAAQPEPSKTN